MKHAISSIEFILQTKGFRHGAGGQPMDTAHSENKEYSKGYTDGQHARRIYSECLCRKMGLIDPKIEVT